MKTLKQLSLLMGLLIYGCQAGPKPIIYGEDGCHFCKMTIVDKLHAAEIVTHKGKVYKFDATECMINFNKSFDANNVKFYLSNNYSEAESLIDATQATYLISDNIPSPMGAFLSAFQNREDALETQSKKTGTIYSWNELKKHLN